MTIFRAERCVICHRHAGVAKSLDQTGTYWCPTCGEPVCDWCAPEDAHRRLDEARRRDPLAPKPVL